MKKYRILLLLLRGLVYGKRGLWWFGARLGPTLGRLLWPALRGALLVKYKLVYWVRKHIAKSPLDLLLQRNILQAALFAVLFLIALPQSRLMAKVDPTQAGRGAVAFNFISSSEIDFEGQEIVVAGALPPAAANARLEGAVQYQPGAELAPDLPRDDLAAEVTAGGLAILKPTVFPGTAAPPSLAERESVVSYEVVAGDSLGGIAVRFGVSLQTLLWENNLTERSLIRPGNILKIPPTSGVMHTVKKGDTVLKIAKVYGAKADEIMSFNKLKGNGALIIGERIMVPGGLKPRSGVAGQSRGSGRSRIAAPPPSLGAASASGFKWPSGARMITQYFSWKHHALDIAGKWQTPNYAAKGGTVEKSQCGWNSGYGCVVIINHGGGVKTLYGHNSALLVSAGDYVEAGQTIGLMGNTGRVYGKTGIHLHFEIIINGVRVNPLGYVR